MRAPSVKNFLRAFSEPRFQIYGIFFTASVIIMLLLRATASFISTDPKPELIPYSLEKQAHATSAVETEVGFYIMSFPLLDITHNNFIVDAIVWFRFDPSLISLDLIQKFSFDKGTIVSKSEPEMKLIENSLFVRYIIRMQFKSDLNYKRFPLSDHTLYIILKNDFISPEQLFFTVRSSIFVISPTIQIQNWTITDYAVESGYFESQLDKYDPAKTVAHPGVLFSIDLAKSGIRKVFIIVLPITILLFISALSLALNIAHLRTSVITLSVGTLTGLIAYRFVLESVIPDVGYFTLADNIFNLVLSCIFIIFLVNVYSARKVETDNILALIKGGTFLSIQVLLISGIYIMLHT